MLLSGSLCILLSLSVYFSLCLCRPDSIVSMSISVSCLSIVSNSLLSLSHSVRMKRRRAQVARRPTASERSLSLIELKLSDTHICAHVMGFLTPNALVTLLWGCCRRFFPTPSRESLLHRMRVVRSALSSSQYLRKTVALPELEAIARDGLKVTHVWEQTYITAVSKTAEARTALSWPPLDTSFQSQM